LQENADVKLTWLGHSTVLFELDGVRILTDPLLRARAGPLVRTAEPVREDLAAIDLILISHTHRDHLDLPSLRRLPRTARLAIPSGGAKHVQALGFAEVIEATAGDSLTVGEVTVVATRADHDPGRGARKQGALPVGYLLHGPPSVYFAGDTDVFPEMSALGPIDVALLPVSGWGPRVPAGHLDAERAAEALGLIEPRVCIPIHWGTLRPVYRRRPYPSDAAAPGELVRLAHETAPKTEVRVLPVGGRTTIGP
jgi:L-ascorbate metabolism protein UlaG (beta-lactamase superfamily)